MRTCPPQSGKEGTEEHDFREDEPGHAPAVGQVDLAAVLTAFALCDGFLEGHEIECPLHQGKFDIRNGKAMCAPLTEDIKSYPVKIEGSRVFVAL